MSDQNPPEISILYQDQDFVAVYKPEGLMVHRSNIDRHETQFLLQILSEQLEQFLYPINRLDRATSGLMLYAFSSEVAHLLHQQLLNNTASKNYLLVCRGHCPAEGTIDHALKPLVDFRKKHKARPEKPAQSAVTRYKRLDTIELDIAVDKYPSSRYSLVQASLLSGRRHQLRRHFKHISHPIIGCPKYGKSTHNRFFAEQLAAPRLLLHSYHMRLAHPRSGKEMTICAEPEGSFSQLLERFAWRTPFSG